MTKEVGSCAPPYDVVCSLAGVCHHLTCCLQRAVAQFWSKVQLKQRRSRRLPRRIPYLACQKLQVLYDDLHIRHAELF